MSFFELGPREEMRFLRPVHGTNVNTHNMNSPPCNFVQVLLLMHLITLSACVPFPVPKDTRLLWCEWADLSSIDRVAAHKDERPGFV